jgi:hypothetical protein
MLSWAPESLLVDGRSLSDLLQGVTVEVMGESVSWGPWNETMKQENKVRAVACLFVWFGLFVWFVCLFVWWCCLFQFA